MFSNLQQFYVTLLSNSSQKLYPSNTLSAFTCHLAQEIDLGSNDSWEVGLAEFTYSPAALGNFKPAITFVGDTNHLIYCDLIPPQFVGSNLVRCLRSYIFASLSGQHIFDNIYYMPVEKRRFQDVRIEVRNLEGKLATFKTSTTPVKLVLHFRRI
jgi:hypothetical protein